MLETSPNRLLINTGNACCTVQAHYNLTLPSLIESLIQNDEAKLGLGGAVLAFTGQHTGRSPKDKFIVDSPSISSKIYWQNNQSLSEENYFRFKTDYFAKLMNTEVFIQDVFARTDTEHRVRIRFVNELAWHSVFVKNMFINPTPSELESFQPDLTVINFPSFKADPETHGTASQTAIVNHFEEKLILICNTRYAGEMKKSIFSFLNYLLPQKGILSMHCAANHAPDEPTDTALFFGLSGTGKTTLSTDPKRVLIGDDEHGWSDQGIFNIEGGSYAKTYGLNPDKEPEIHNATSLFGSVLENVIYDSANRELDFNDMSITENARCAIAIENFPNVSATGLGLHPQNIFFLTCDAFGVLPPLSILNPAQAIYHFLSGFTSKVAGTEDGISQPQPSFSSCFGKPFLPLSPVEYGKLFQEKIKRYNSRCWLVNTGWTKGGYQDGERISIKHTRALLSFVFSGNYIPTDFQSEPYFGLKFPRQVPGVPSFLLNPNSAWQNSDTYDQAALALKEKFRANFKQFENHVDADVLEWAI